MPKGRMVPFFTSEDVARILCAIPEDVVSGALELRAERCPTSIEFLRREIRTILEIARFALSPSTIKAVELALSFLGDTSFRPRFRRGVRG